MSESLEDRCGADVAAYALGALVPAEAERLRVHIDSCTVCAEELAAFRSIVGDLAISPVRMTAPASLRRRVQRAIEDEPRLQPAARRERHRIRPAPTRLVLPRLTPAFAGGLALVLAAIVVVAIALSGGLSGSGSSTRVVSAQVTGRGTAAVHVEGNRGELVVRRFPAPPRGKIYEVWLKRHGSDRPIPTHALFTPTGDGDGDVDVPGSLRGVTHVLVTPEPAGGSRTPTHDPVIVASL